MKKLLCSEVTLREIHIFESTLQRLFKDYTADLTTGLRIQRTGMILGHTEMDVSSK